jgi:hydrogenase-4 component B
MSLVLIIIGIILVAVSGLPCLFMLRWPMASQRLNAGLMVSGAAAGLAGGWSGLWINKPLISDFPWQAGGGSIIGIDPLSGFFLIPIFLMGGLGAVYGLGYWPQPEHPGNGRKLRFFWGTLTAGLALLVISRHAMAFLFGWEVMALSAFVLITVEEQKEECRRASWIYLICTHIGTITLFALFCLWRWATGSYDLKPVAAEAIGLGVMNVIFILLLIGFGIKAGIIPLHFWLPAAHAAAPSHVSAMLSGVVLKMGIYGLIRFLSLLPDPPHFWGGLILLLGAVSGLLGVVFAIGQHDLKRLLAYHSVENIGIILMGLGLAMLGVSAGEPVWIVLGLAGCLLHVWNHFLFKSLLFLGAGSVIHHAHTRQIDHLGGLARSMPWTAGMFLLGAVAICGLPPLNGFVSELFIYLGLLGSMASDGNMGFPAFVVVPVLAMIGALATACFVKVYGSVFLGIPRTDAARDLHESPVSMRGPMLVLSAACAVIGLAPILMGPILDNVIANWRGQTDTSLPSLCTAAPLKVISLISVLLAAVIALWACILQLIRRVSKYAGTWDCGYARPTPRMQYTASSFAQMIIAMFGWVLRPHVHHPSIEGLFARPAKMESHIDELILDRVFLPAGRRIADWFGWFRRFQQGMAQKYVLYILIMVILMLSTLIPFEKFITRLFAR